MHIKWLQEWQHCGMLFMLTWGAADCSLCGEGLCGPALALAHSSHVQATRANRCGAHCSNAEYLAGWPGT